MSTLINLEIGDVHFAIRSRYRVLPQKDNPAYSAFLKSSRKDTRDIDISVLPSGKGARILQTAKRIFDGGGSWRMFRDGADYILSFNSAGVRSQPFWLARASRDFSRAVVYCGEDLTRVTKGVTTLSNPVRYPLDQILLMHLLALREGAIIHAAGVVIKGRGLIFPGRSGGGKSTITRCLMARDDISILSDDRVIVRNGGKTIMVFGTPWPGDAGIARNKKSELRGIFFMHPGQATRITRIDPGTAFEKLLPVTSIPWYDRETIPSIFAFLEKLVSRVPAYLLRFRPTPEVADVIAEFVSA